MDIAGCPGSSDESDGEENDIDDVVFSTLFFDNVIENDSNQDSYAVM